MPPPRPAVDLRVLKLTGGGRERWSAIGLLLLVSLLAYFLLLHWWWTAPMLELRSQMQELRDQEQRLRMHVRQRPAIDRRLAEVRAFDRGNAGFLPEVNAQLAAAGLVQRLEVVVKQVGDEGCEVVNRTPMPAAQRGEERYPRVAVLVRLRCGASEFASLLHTLEAGRPQLFLDNLNIQSRRLYAVPNQEAVAAGALDISFDLYGYLRTPLEVADEG